MFDPHSQRPLFGGRAPDVPHDQLEGAVLVAHGLAEAEELVVDQLVALGVEPAEEGHLGLARQTGKAVLIKVKK